MVNNLEYLVVIEMTGTDYSACVSDLPGYLHT
jgi:hypothetical protein